MLILMKIVMKGFMTKKNGVETVTLEKKEKNELSKYFT